jgi:hypothetical protein
VLTFDTHHLLFSTAVGPSSPLEILDRPLVNFCGAPAGEGSKVSALTSLGVLFARVQTKLAGFKFSNHRDSSPLGRTYTKDRTLADIIRLDIVRFSRYLSASSPLNC